MRRIAIYAALAALSDATGKASFDWKSAPAAEHLHFRPCYDSFQCARLTLPLNWQDDYDKRTVTIAVIKRPAVVSRDDPSYAGIVFTQPGGPGNSGVEYMLGRHERLRDIIDIPGKRHYDLVAFDPRGIGNSSPNISCFSGLAAHMRAKEMQTIGLTDLSARGLAYHLAAAKVDGKQCEKTHGDFLEYVGTTSVARDMLQILDELHREEDEEEHVEDADEDVRLELRSLEDDKHDHKKLLPRLNYIGISYGTLLGNYFASMFPGRVGRMVLDGVCDAPEYATSQEWMNDTIDTDEAMKVFFHGCFSAESKCALYRETDSSPEDIYDRFWAWANQLDEEPLYVVNPQGLRIVIRSSEVRLFLIKALYKAEYESQSVARFFHAAMTQPDTLYDAYGAMLNVDGDADACASTTLDPIALFDRQIAISCSDADDLTGKPPAYWQDYVNKLRSMSPFASEFQALMRLPCSAWPRRPKWSFKGPFKTPTASRDLRQDSPAAPLLFLSNTLDPITPLSNARNMSKMHPGSGVLVQNATGHCVVLGPYTQCVKDVVSRYFDTGDVPKDEAWCGIEKGAWDQPGEETELTALRYPYVL